MAEVPAFDRVGEDFIEYYSTMRGHVRQELVRQYMVETLNQYGPEEGELIDVGCGDGRDARFLSHAGYKFKATLVDPSPEMLHQARRNNNPGTLTIRTDINGTARRPTLAGRFDLVISHGVLQYDVEDQPGHVEKLVQLAKPGSGLVSILTKGFAGGLDRLNSQKASRDVIDTFQETGISRNNLGELTIALRMHEIEEMLQAAGAIVLRSGGVRLFADGDYRLLREVPMQEKLEILKREYKDGTDKLLKHRGKMLHVVARRGDT